MRPLGLEMGEVSIAAFEGVADASNVVAVALERCADALELELGADHHVGLSERQPFHVYEGARPAQHLRLRPLPRLIGRERRLAHAVARAISESVLQDIRAG